MNSEMTSSKPYLIRAIYEWIADNNCTPYVSINTNFPRVDIPKGYAIDGLITLDISMASTKELMIDNKAISCKARFNGVVHHLYIPIGSIIAIFAEETKQGMNFPEEEYLEEDYDDNTEFQPENSQPKATSRFQVLDGGKD